MILKTDTWGRYCAEQNVYSSSLYSELCQRTAERERESEKKSDTERYKKAYTDIVLLTRSSSISHITS